MATFSFVSEHPYSITVRRLPAAESPHVDLVKDFFRFRKFDCKPATEKVAFLLQNVGQNYLATVWTDLELSEEQEKFIAKSAYEYLEKDYLKKREQRFFSKV